ncbi:HECT domain-containing protein [Ophiocordyceps camponoti-floridani]|uniref:HECT-type E3 ubiquitin transferase n=1 Tax=Ophiocordyceps camponoti-floridani TaxID=2030778 RepID=A0A8H4VH51_9HYPO|nr:HECT domain-containing protein [Ophiocordyceps camponoti-floridani]
MTPLMRSVAASGAPDPADSRPKSPKDTADALRHLTAGLWQESLFARLPDDAPPELQDLVQDIDNPRRVYAIHKASRRHDFQLLVDRYVVQLRVGCASPHCTTSTCFTCRRRLAGKAPVRRYNPTSARTLAVYLASQDSPEKGLCPYLQRSKEPPAAVNTLVFSAQFASTSLLSGKPVNSKKQSSHHKPVHITTHRSPQRQSEAAVVNRRHCRPADDDGGSPSPSKLGMHERPVSRDYRSFAAAAFGTVAFKMLEWLTPQGVEYMSKTLREVGCPDSSTVDPDSVASEQGQPDEAVQLESSAKLSQSDSAPKAQKYNHDKPYPVDAAPPSRNHHGPRSSFRNPASPNTNRRGSVEPLSIPNAKDEAKPPPRSATLNGFHLDKRSRPATKIVPGVIPRGVPEVQLKQPAFFDNVPCPTTLSVQDVKEADPGSSDQGDVDDDSTINSAPSLIEGRLHKLAKADSQQVMSEQEALRVDCPLPQSLRRLDVELVDFVCDTFLEDNTLERSTWAPAYSVETLPIPQNKPCRLVRRERPGLTIPRAQWKDFNEQTIFDVLSNPRSLVQSFTRDGKLYDSQTLWYCMLRLTRAAPSLVLHSLWLAASSLFAPPDSLKDARVKTRGMFDGSTDSFSDFEASCVLSVCLHTLVAAVPCVSDSKTLYDMSRIRSHGLVMAVGGIGARQPPSMCLEFDDVFSNDLALRLARRLFCAITARQCFAEIADCESSQASRHEGDLDVLRPLLSQLDLMSTDPVRVLEFSPAERLLHETRVPTLLLDWARTILLKEWDGRPEFSCDGPFFGALSLMATLYEHRSSLLLGDVQFRVDYLSERLDAMAMPVAWLAFTSTRQKRHLLDYPYLFSPEALVNYFRALNFSRMSRTFEESSSLKTRMSAIVDPGSLVTNPHHKNVLQDMLKTASSKFLVLEIGRKNVVRDAFDQLWRRQERELLRPLKIHLGEEGGEQGFDSGGVQQEFFRMAIAQCLDPDFGAFTIDERTRAAWFVPGSVVEEWKFELMGLLVSLAIYNGLTLPVTFPEALYRKLLGQPVDQLHHIKDAWPELSSGLSALLEWDEINGLIEDVFARTYEFSVAAFGSDVTRPMTNDGSTWPQELPPRSRPWRAADEAPLVTNANRNEFVGDYIRYLTDVSVQPQFRAFERGFRACLDVKSLTLLTPDILQSVVEGIQEIDILELRRYARYVGWDASHRTVKDLWSVVKRFDDRMKRKLLEFVTASERIPVGGMRNLQFVVQRNGEADEGGHLPTAYTCYGTLLLPEYKDREVLRERLTMALENAQGFGFA